MRLARPMLAVAAVVLAGAAPHALAQTASVQAQSLFDEGTPSKNDPENA
jgi:hypothetical protein